MIACVEQSTPTARFCVVLWVGKVGWASVGVRTWCGTETDIANGVLQLPDSLLDGTKYPSGKAVGMVIGCCEKCKGNLAAKAPPKST
jgi:hypothetical protein